MKTIKILSIFAIFLAFAACSDDDPIILPVESVSITNIEAIQSADYSVNPPLITGDYIKFNFATGTTTTGDVWDIAFRGTTILVNGGAKFNDDEPARTGTAGIYITSGTLAGVTSADPTQLVQDSATELAIATGSGNGWYTYTGPPNHLITPTAGEILVIKTSNNNFVKMEILSYYKDGDTSSDSQNYTFDYVYNPNEGDINF